MQIDQFNKKLALLIAPAAILIFIWGIWAVPILSHNEARRMVVIQELLRNNEWLLPTLNNETYLAKPPLIYWLGAAFALLLESTAEWALRLPSGLMALGVVSLTYNRLRRHTSHGAALWAAAILISSEAFINHARSTQIGMLLTLCLSLAMFSFFEFIKHGKKKQLLIAYAGLGLAFLSKGPVCLLFFIPPLAIFGLLKDRKALQGLAWLPGWLLMALIGLPWYGLIMAQMGPDAFGAVINKDISGKMAGATKNSPIYTYLLFLLGAFAPWFITLFCQSRSQWQKIKHSDETVFFLSWAITPVLIMSLIGEKHGKYILPMFPALAAFLGIWCHELFLTARRRWPVKTEKTAIALLFLLFSGHFLFYLIAEPRIYNHRYSALKPMAAAIDQIDPNLAVYSHKKAYIQLTYYLRRPIPVRTTKEIETMLANGQEFLLVSNNKNWKELEGLNLIIEKEFKPFLKRNRKGRIYHSP